VSVGHELVTALQLAQPDATARMVVNAAPPVVQAIPTEVLGGGRVAVVDAPIDIKLELQDTTGAPVRPSEVVGAERVTLTLPRLPVSDADASAGATFHWLYELYDGDAILGYAWAPDEVVDPAADTVTFSVPVAGLQGTVFVPSAIIPGYVANHDPLVHVWSGPTLEARDFGFAGPQWTTFAVLAPQVRLRLFVWSPVVDNYAWIDVAGVGPVGAPDGPPTAPAAGEPSGGPPG
jgi:hypothetical protein